MDNSVGASERSSKDQEAREKAFTACTEWLANTGVKFSFSFKKKYIFKEKFEYLFCRSICNQKASGKNWISKT